MNAEIDVSNVTLKTERLTLRPWRSSDLDDFYEYAKVDGVGQMAGWTPHKSREESLEILTRFVEEKKTFAIVIDGKAVGSVGIELYNEEQFPELDEYRVREIGFALSKDHWGRGFMTEAVREVIRYIFEETDVDVLLCGHFFRNTRSARVQEKCGFKNYKTAKYNTRYGTVEDEQINILTRKDLTEAR